jgi:hypothetical protein
MTNWALQYSGGSGGFLLLHLLLLSDQFYTAFDRDLSLDQIIQEHWNIKSPDQWKNTEIWPSAQITADSLTNVDKIYFQCNPFGDDSNSILEELLCKKIVIYTDYHSQDLLAYYKKAYWYFGQNIRNVKYAKFKKFLKMWQTHYNNIKDPLWPKCLSVRQIDRLPENIQREILSNPSTNSVLNFKYQDRAPGAYFNNELVHSPMIPYLESADVVVKLQDLVNSDAKILETLFNIPKINSKQLALLQKWKHHHDKKLLTSVGIIS